MNCSEGNNGNLKSLDDCISFLEDAVGLASWSLQRDYDQSCLAHLRELKLRNKPAPAAAGVLVSADDIGNQHSTNRYLFKRLCAVFSIELGKDRIAEALDKVDQYHADREALRAEKAGLIRDVKHYLAKCEALAARVEALEADAERYRWLRHQNNRERGAATLLDFMDCDAAIDAALERLKVLEEQPDEYRYKPKIAPAFDEPHKEG